MPFYGQSFKLANEANHGLNEKSFGGASGGEFTKSDGFLSYYEVINKLLCYVQSLCYCIPLNTIIVSYSM